MPQWIFHGAEDNDTDIETGYGGAMVGSRAVVRALRAMGGNPRYTEYPDEMHPMWHRAYATPRIAAVDAQPAPARRAVRLFALGTTQARQNR